MTSICYHANSLLKDLKLLLMRARKRLIHLRSTRRQMMMMYHTLYLYHIHINDMYESKHMILVSYMMKMNVHIICYLSIGIEIGTLNNIL